MSMSHGVKLNPQNDIIKVTNGEMQHRLNKLQVTNKSTKWINQDDKAKNGKENVMDRATIRIHEVIWP